MSQGSWLITGGLGGLGLLFAQWAVISNARHLHLLDCKPGHQAPDVISSQQSGDCAVRVTRGDLAKAEDARSVTCSHAARSSNPLSGVMHAAGVLQAL